MNSNEYCSTIFYPFDGIHAPRLVCNKKYFSYFSIETYVVGTQKNCFNVVGTQKNRHKKCIVITFHDS